MKLLIQILTLFAVFVGLLNITVHEIGFYLVVTFIGWLGIGTCIYYLKNAFPELNHLSQEKMMEYHKNAAISYGGFILVQVLGYIILQPHFAGVLIALGSASIAFGLYILCAQKCLTNSKFSDSR